MNLWLVWLQSGNVFFKNWHGFLLSSQKTEKLLLIPPTDNFSFCHPRMLSAQCYQWLLEASLNSFIPALLRGLEDPSKRIFSLSEVLHKARKKPVSPLVPPLAEQHCKAADPGYGLFPQPEVSVLHSSRTNSLACQHETPRKAWEVKSCSPRTFYQ